MSRLAAHPPATIPRHGVKPDGESLRILNLREVAQRAVEYLLHGVFRIFRMPADFHAEGIDRVLQQPDRLLDGFGSVAAQELGGLDQFRAHRLGSSRARTVYSPTG